LSRVSERKKPSGDASGRQKRRGRGRQPYPDSEKEATGRGGRLEKERYGLGTQVVPRRRS